MMDDEEDDYGLEEDEIDESNVYVARDRYNGRPSRHHNQQQHYYEPAPQPHVRNYDVATASTDHRTSRHRAAAATTITAVEAADSRRQSTSSHAAVRRRADEAWTRGRGRAHRQHHAIPSQLNEEEEDEEQQQPQAPLDEAPSPPKRAQLRQPHQSKEVTRPPTLQTEPLPTGGPHFYTSTPIQSAAPLARMEDPDENNATIWTTLANASTQVQPAGSPCKLGQAVRVVARRPDSDSAYSASPVDESEDSRSSTTSSGSAAVQSSNGSAQIIMQSDVAEQLNKTSFGHDVTHTYANLPIQQVIRHHPHHHHHHHLDEHRTPSTIRSLHISSL